MNHKTPPPLFSFQQVMVATFLGGLLAGAGLMAINRRRLGHNEEAGTVILLGFFGQVFLLLIGFLVSANVPHWLFWFAQSFVMRKWYESEQSDLFERHLANGGSQASWWSAIGLSLAVLVLTFLLLMRLFVM